MDFNFDQWMELFRTDPAAFEARRKRELETVIACAPVASQPRLKGLQFKIDAERRLAKTSLGGCIRINAMMWDSLSELRQRLTEAALLPTPEAQSREKPEPAIVLEFKRRK